MIDTLFEFLVLKSIGVAILLCLIVVIRPTVLKRLNVRVAYGLWLMLPVYLLIPVSNAEVTSTGGFMTFILGSEAFFENLADKEGFYGNQTALWGLMIWLWGCLAMLTVFFFRYRRLKSSLEILTTKNISGMVDAGDSKLINNIQFVSSPLIDVPAVFGLFQPYLVLPDDFSSLPTKNQQMILQHEFYHLNRHDHRYNFLRVLIKSLFWFNPMFYWADKYCEADQEMSCDLGVLQNADIEKRKIYANALLDSMSGVKRNKLVSQWKYKSLIKERVKMLKNINSKKWHSWVAAAFAASAIWGTSSLVMAEKEGISDSGAIPITIIQPGYPRKAAEEGVEGWVKLRFDIDSNGFPYEIAVIDDKPKGVFVEDAIKAVRQWQFKTKGGQNNLIYTMEFVLEAPEGEESL